MQLTAPPRYIAVDWSGARDAAEARKKIWLAEVANGRFVRLEAGRSREEIAEHLIDVARSGEPLSVGLDFAFSFPKWFLQQHKQATARAMWSLVSSQGEGWLQSCAPPFWGLAGRTKPQGIQHFRLTETLVSKEGLGAPKSVFQIGGAGAVGKGSVRGMPILARLSEAGFSVWPFDEPGLHTVVEIYPRVFTKGLVKNDPRGREAFAGRLEPLPDPHMLRQVRDSEDALDAAASAAAMSRLLRGLSSPVSLAPEARLEGLIWGPSGSLQHSTGLPAG